MSLHAPFLMIVVTVVRVGMAVFLVLFFFVLSECRLFVAVQGFIISVPLFVGSNHEDIVEIA